MDAMLQMFADFIGFFAEIGAGFASTGAGYQPEVPEELE